MAEITGSKVKLDDRAGSKELYSALLMTGLRVELCRLPFGDIAFEGKGKDDCPVLIGIEHKRISDVIKCIGDGRFAGHQLPGLIEQYNVTYLVVEGKIRVGAGGVLQELHNGSGRYFDVGFGNRTFRYSDLVAWLCTIQHRAGVNVIKTLDQSESAATIYAIHRWWDKGFDHHRSHLAFDLAADAASMVANLTRPNLVRRMAKELPGVGWEKSQGVSKQFETVVRMVGADISDWMAIPGIGKTMAERIVKALGWEE